MCININNYHVLLNNGAEQTAYKRLKPCCSLKFVCNNYINQFIKKNQDKLELRTLICTFPEFNVIIYILIVVSYIYKKKHVLPKCNYCIIVSNNFVIGCSNSICHL